MWVDDFKTNRLITNFGKDRNNQSSPPVLNAANKYPRITPLSPSIIPVQLEAPVTAILTAPPASLLSASPAPPTPPTPPTQFLFHKKRYLIEGYWMSQKVEKLKSNHGHFFVYVHGLQGTGEDLTRYAVYVSNAFNTSKSQKIGRILLTLISKQNEEKKTLEGIEVCGKRLYYEILDFFDDQMKIMKEEGCHQIPSRFSVNFISHSLGGLISRCAIYWLFGRNQDEEEGDPNSSYAMKHKLFKQYCVPYTFMSICSPHLGIRKGKQNLYVVKTMAKHVCSSWMGQTGLELYMEDGCEKMGEPLLFRMTKGDYMKALHRFTYCTLMSPVYGDLLVPFSSSSIRVFNPYLRCKKIRRNPNIFVLQGFCGFDQKSYQYKALSRMYVTSNCRTKIEPLHSGLRKSQIMKTSHNVTTVEKSDHNNHITQTSASVSLMEALSLMSTGYTGFHNETEDEFFGGDSNQEVAFDPKGTEYDIKSVPIKRSKTFTSDSHGSLQYHQEALQNLHKLKWRRIDIEIRLPSVLNSMQVHLAPLGQMSHMNLLSGSASAEILENGKTFVQNIVDGVIMNDLILFSDSTSVT